jgi:hypothetical protein
MQAFEKEVNRLVDLLGKIPLDATEAREKIAAQIEALAERLNNRNDIDESRRTTIGNSLDGMLRLLVEQKGASEHASATLDAGKLEIIRNKLEGQE